MYTPKIINGLYYAFRCTETRNTGHLNCALSSWFWAAICTDVAVTVGYITNNSNKCMSAYTEILNYLQKFLTPKIQYYGNTDTIITNKVKTVEKVRALGCHFSLAIWDDTPTTSEQTPARQAGTQFAYHRGMEV